MISFSQYRALNRFGLGTGPDDLNASSDDPKEWLLQQLQAQSDPGPDVPDSVSSLIAFHEWQVKRKPRIQLPSATLPYAA